MSLGGIPTGEFQAIFQVLEMTCEIERPEPFKFINFPSAEAVGLKASVAADGESVVLSTYKPIKGIVLDVDGDEVKWSDQAIDLVPDDPQTIKAIGLKGRDIKHRYIGLADS
jgi:beta-mannosidase